MRFPLETAKTRSRELTARLAVIATAVLAAPLMGADCSLDEIAESLEKACQTNLLVTTNAEDQNPSQPDAFVVCLPGACTLRDAIATANACGGIHNIDVPAGTYILNSPERNPMDTPSASMVHEAADGPVGLPVITSDIRIRPVDDNVAIVRNLDDADPFRIFHVAPGGKLHLDRITLAFGQTPNDGSNSRRQDGGAILNDGALGLVHTAVAGSEAFRRGGGVANYGTFRSNESLFFVNQVHVGDWLPEGDGGGALYNGPSAEATLSETMAYQNTAGTAGVGGGVSSRGQLEIVESILMENRSAKSGGAIYSRAGTVRISQSALTENVAAVEGGALYASESAGEVWIQSSTLSFNAADDGSAISYFGTGGIAIEDSTVVHNTSHVAGSSPEGAAVDVRGAAGRVMNSIIANSRGLMGAPAGAGGSTLDCRLDGAHILFFDPGIDSDGSCSSYTTTDPGLRPLADNGGVTPTHALEPFSPALDTGSLCQIFDQRFEVRPRDGDGDGDIVCDIGAFEAQAGETSDSSGAPFHPVHWIRTHVPGLAFAGEPVPVESF